MTGPPERPYAAEVAARLEALLAERFVGAYLGGSLALGDYRPGRSDVDIAAVVDKPLERARKTAIGERLSHEALPCPARRLELVVYTAAAAAAASLDGAFELNLNTGAETPFRLDTNPGSAPGHWFAIDRSILAQAGVALTGPPAPQIFAPIEPDLLRPLLVGSIAWHRRAILAPGANHPTRPRRAARMPCSTPVGRCGSSPTAIGPPSPRRGAGRWITTRRTAR